MQQRVSSARRAGRVVAAVLIAALGVAPAAFAQTPTPKPADKKAEKKPAAKPAARPAQAQVAPAAPAPSSQAQNAQPNLMYSPWIKICEASAQTNNKKVCVVRKDARLENGQPVLVTQIIEPDGGEKKFQVIIPIPVHVQPGTRVLIDQEQLGTAPYMVCSPIGCSSEYKVEADTVSKLKKGKGIIVQAYNVYNQVISLPMPLADFAKAYDGPPIDPKALEEQQRKLQEELQKKAEEARKKLEAQQPAAPATAPKQ
jgi:invasion protein IalB